MNQHIEIAKETYEKSGVNFWGLFEWHMHHGIVVCAPDCFALAYFCKQGDPLSPVASQDETDTLHITWAGGNMRSIIPNFLGRCKYVSFHRHTKKSKRLRLIKINNINLKIQKL